MADRWPTWRTKLSPGLVEEWLTFLETVSSYDVAIEALRMYLRSSNYNPTMARVREFAQRISQQGAREPIHDGAPGVWVQCISHPKEQKVGWFCGWAYNVYRPRPDEDTQVQDAEQLRAELTETEGGVWQVRREIGRPIPYDEMQASWRRLRGIHRPKWLSKMRIGLVVAEVMAKIPQETPHE